MIAAAFTSIRPSTPKTNQVVLTATAAHLETARTLAKLRCDLHEGFRSDGADFGADRNSQVEFDGLVTELVVLIALVGEGLRPTDFQLVTNPAPKCADFTLNGIHYDLKASRKPWWCCNEEARLSADKQVDRFLPVQILDDTRFRLYAPVTSATIGKWQLREGHSPYRSCLFTQLPTLPSLRALLR